MVDRNWMLAIVASLALMVAAMGVCCTGVAVALLTSKRSSPASSPAPSTRRINPVEPDLDQELAESVRLRRWWKAPLTAAQVDELAKFLIESNSNHWVFVDSRLQMARVKNNVSVEAIVENLGPSSVAPDGFYKKRMLRWFISPQQAKRWDRGEALQALLVGATRSTRASRRARAIRSSP